MGHHDAAGNDSPVSGRLHRRLTAAVVLPLGVITVVLAVLTWPGRATLARRLPEGVGIPKDASLLDADVEGVRLDKCTFVPGAEGPTICDHVTVRLREGPDADETVSFEVPPSASSPELREGERIVVLESKGADPRLRYTYFDHVRRTPVVVLAALFAAAVLALGRRRGLGALAGLLVTVGALTVYMVPAILGGTSPVLAAVVTASGVMIATLYLAHGFNLRTTVALFGTLGALVLTALLAWVFVGASRISGLVSEEALLVRVQAGALNLEGLVLAGIVIGALGVLDDVTVTQVSAVWEIREVDRTLGLRELYRRGLRVGRDHIASTVNTLVLAYAGAALPLFILFNLSDQSAASILNGETVATEVIRTLVGSLGLVAAVPLTTLLAAWAARSGAPSVAEPPHRDFPPLGDDWPVFDDAP